MVNSENAIEVRNVKKHFKVYYDRGETFKDKILSRGRTKYEKREVLKGISFDVKKGEAIGLIGKNGCGKSTTLKMLTKIIYPNEGTVEMQGRVSSLLELGAGFHPDMSGRENIYMNAAVFGLTRKEIDQRVEDIIAFSELEDFIENPVRTYSSGMYMRLAFSVAINVDADILLIDEILAVGDISFQKKCFERLKEIKNQGTTIVIVSHSLDQIEKICNRSIWIENGLIRQEGMPKDVHTNYLQAMETERLQRVEADYYKKLEQRSAEKNLENNAENNADGNAENNADGNADYNAEQDAVNPETNNRVSEDTKSVENTQDVSDSVKATEEIPSQDIDQDSQSDQGNDENQVTEEKQSVEKKLSLREKYNLKHDLLLMGEKAIKRAGDGRVRVTEMYLTDWEGNETIVHNTGAGFKVFLGYKAYAKDLKGTFSIVIYRDDGIYCFGTNTYIESREIRDIGDEGMIEIDFPQNNLLPGKYFFGLNIHDMEVVNMDFMHFIPELHIKAEKEQQGICHMENIWHFE